MKMQEYSNGDKTIRATEKMFNLLYKDLGFKPAEEKAPEEPADQEENNEEEIPFDEEETNLEELKVDELRALAKDLGLEGYSKLKKEELITAIEGE